MLQELHASPSVVHWCHRRSYVTSSCKVQTAVSQMPRFRLEKRVKSLLTMILGAVLGFGATVLAIGSVVLLLAGLGGGILVRERPSTARVLNYDPSDVVLRAAFTGVAALAVASLYIVILRRLRCADRRDA